MVVSLVSGKIHKHDVQVLGTSLKGTSSYGFELISFEELSRRVIIQNDEVTFLYHEDFEVNGKLSVVLFDKLLKFNTADFLQEEGRFEALAHAAAGHYNLPKIELLLDKEGITDSETNKLNAKLNEAYEAIEAYEVEIMTISKAKLLDIMDGVIKVVKAKEAEGQAVVYLEDIWEEVLRTNHLHEITPYFLFQSFVHHQQLTGIKLENHQGKSKIQLT